MSQTDRVFTGSIPALYNQYLGPLIFEPYAIDLTDRLAKMTEGDVLETAAGTGIVTRALARTLAPAVRITATDLNQPMLDFAAAQGSTSRVTSRQADALRLPFDDGAFDMVVCQFGAMFFPDTVTAFAEARRVLKPRGKFIFSVWDRIEQNEFAAVVTESIGMLFPENPPQFLARTPHGYHDVTRVRADIEAAGFTGVEIETIERRSRAPSPSGPAIGYCQGTPLRNEIEAHGTDRLDEATQVATAALAARFGTGSVDGKIQAHIFVAFCT
jgi:ubiquinone/menaquinone biosynthesis C-methylase UbiE